MPAKPRPKKSSIRRPEPPAAAPAPADPRRAFRAWFWGLAALALVVRVINALYILHPQNPFYDPSGLPRSVDMHDNHVQAIEILKNHGFPDSFFQHSPLYPTIIAAVYLFFPGQFARVYGLQILAGALACAMVYGAGRRLFGEGPARAAGLLAALYGPLLHNDLIFQSDALAPPMVLGLLWLTLLWAERPRPLALACAMGAVLGLCAGQRSNLALLGPVIAAWMIWIPRRHPLRERLISIGIVAAVSLLFIAPFCIHNTRVIGKPTLMQGHVEKTLGHSLGTESTGYFNYPEGCPDNPRWPVFSLGFARLSLAKLRYLFSWFEFPDLYNYYITGRFSPLIRFNPLTFRIVGPLGLLGLLLGLRRFKALALPYLFLLVMTLSILAFYVSSRFRAPMMPFFFLFAAQAVFEAIALARRRAWPALAPRLGLVVALALFVNVMDTSRFHSMWYSDTTMGNMFMSQMAKAGQRGNAPAAKLAAERLLWVRFPVYQQQGYEFLAQIDQFLGQTGEARRCEAIAKKLEEILKTQPVVDYNGNTYFPPTDSFGPIDPLKHAAAPKDLIGTTASVYPPRPGAKKVVPAGQ